MPTQDRVRLDNARQTKQAWPKPSHPYQQCPVAPTELPLGCTPQGNIELMPKKDILKLKSAPRLEQVGDNCPKQMEHRDHRVDDELILPYRANRADGIFGNDRCPLVSLEQVFIGGKISSLPRGIGLRVNRIAGGQRPSSWPSSMPPVRVFTKEHFLRRPNYNQPGELRGILNRQRREADIF
jgi:hypothetical protein